MNSKKYLNTKQVGSLFDVNESTVRRWASSGKIECISSAGGHRKFSYQNVMSFANDQGLKINSGEIPYNINRKTIIDDSVKHVFNNDAKSLEMIFVQLYLDGTLLPDLMDNFVEKILVKIQDKLDQREVSVAEEHIARKVVSKALNNFKLTVSNHVSRDNENILCLNLENDIPDLPIDMIQILLENNNFNVHNCGANTSIKDIKKLLSNQTYKAIFIYLCDRQCCTATVKDNIKKTNSDLEQVSILAKKYNIKLYLGGPSFKNINKNILKNYNTFTKYSESLKIK
ncbi:hypothetical protein OAH62_01480 [Candidatus Marinimicrobia bacterium]|nr:hypothetical protein [Candidatus Neomarinimicrobiota bacterium]